MHEFLQHPWLWIRETLRRRWWDVLIVIAFLSLVADLVFRLLGL